MGNGGSSSLVELAVEYAHLRWAARLTSGRQESTDRSMSDHVPFTPNPYKQVTTEEPDAFPLFSIPPPSLAVTPPKYFE